MMPSRYRTAAFAAAASASSLLFLTAGPSLAQQQQRQSSAQTLLEEVVVTARRREESLQDLPLSIAAFNAQQMEAQGIQSIEDVGDFVPNVTLTQSDRADNTRIVIRGIGGGHPDPVFVFGAGMYIDGHYIPNSLGGYMSTMDIERVEVLRGPQGTLFGKNVTGGAVNIISAKPGPDFDSSITLRAAEDNQQTVRGMINFPVNDKVYMRLGAALETFDGYYHNRHLDIDTGGYDAKTLNAAVRWEPGKWTVDANIFHIKRRDDNLGTQCSELGHPPGTFNAAPTWGGFPGRVDRLYTGADQAYHDACNADSAMGRFINSSDKVTFANIDQDSVFLGGQWDSNGPVGGLDNLTVKLNGSYRYNHYNYMQDRDASFLDIDAIGTFLGASDTGQDNTTRGAEFIVEGQASDRLQFTVGFNYFYELAKNGDGDCRTRWVADPSNIAILEDANGNPILDANNQVQPLNPGRQLLCENGGGLYFELVANPHPNGGSPAFMNQERVENESKAVFGHLTYSLTDNWDLDFGARYTQDDRNFWNMEGPNWVGGCSVGITTAGQQNVNDPSTTGIHTALCGATTPTLLVDFDSTVKGGLFNHASKTFSATTPMISLTRHLQGGGTLQSGMYYFLYSEGFLTGGFNTELNSNLPTAGELLTYDPEHVKNYEVGFKGTFANGNMQLNADVFTMKYKNKQDQISIANPNGLYGIDDPLGVVQNVSSVDISGLELELRASPWDGGFISLDIGTLSNKYGSYRYKDPTGGAGTVDLTNNEIIDLTPDHTVNLAIEHQITLASGATITPRLNMYNSGGIEYRDKLRSDPNTPCYQPAYTRVGARVTFESAEGNWRAALFGDNLTDETIYETCGTSRGVWRYRYERPKWWGLEFSMRWGASAS